MIRDPRPLYVIGGFGGDYSGNAFGLTPQWLTDPAGYSRDFIDQMKRLGGPDKIRLLILIPNGALFAQVFSSVLYPRLTPVLLDYFEVQLPQVCGGYSIGVHFGWPIPTHFDISRLDIMDATSAPTPDQRREWLRLNCVPFRARSGVRWFSADQSTGSPESDLAAADDYLRPFGMWIMEEAWPLYLVGPGQGPGGLAYKPDRARMSRRPAEISYAGFDALFWHDEQFGPDIEPHCIVYQDPAAPKPTAAMAARLRANGVIMGIGGGFDDAYARAVTGL